MNHQNEQSSQSESSNSSESINYSKNDLIQKLCHTNYSREEKERIFLSNNGRKCRTCHKLKINKKLSPSNFSPQHRNCICLCHTQVERRNVNELPFENGNENNNNAENNNDNNNNNNIGANQSNLIDGEINIQNDSLEIEGNEANPNEQRQQENNNHLPRRNRIRANNGNNNNGEDGSNRSEGSNNNGNGNGNNG